MGILFVGFRLHSYWLELDPSRITPMGWAGVAALSIIYGAANFLLAMAWWHLLQLLGATATRVVSIKIYGISQLARYLPGNIFHLAGRQALGMAANIPAKGLAQSMIWELGLVAIAGAQFGWLILPFLFPSFPGFASVILPLASSILTGAVLQGMVGRQATWSFFWQILFLFVSGSVFIVLLALISGGKGLTAWNCLAIGGGYIVAWLVGLVTPGAPAGVGVREFILLFLLNGMVAEMDLLVTVLVVRLVTVLGDLVFFMAAHAIPSKVCQTEERHV